MRAFSVFRHSTPDAPGILTTQFDRPCFAFSSSLHTRKSQALGFITRQGFCAQLLERADKLTTAGRSSGRCGRETLTHAEQRESQGLQSVGRKGTLYRSQPFRTSNALQLFEQRHHAREGNRQHRDITTRRRRGRIVQTFDLRRAAQCARAKLSTVSSDRAASARADEDVCPAFAIETHPGLPLPVSP